MDIFDALTLLGGLCLFLFGMNVMGESLESRAGGKLRSLLGRMTGSKMAGFLTGLGITAIIQSSSATTVMAVGFVNSGLLTLKQAINVIMGANVGTTVTAWILSLSGISSSATWVKLLKPSSFTPVLALLGIIYYMFCKGGKKRDTGAILLGFATLMFGMDTMSAAVSGLRDVPAFQSLFVLFKNPVLGVLAGALLTAVIQSSSASVGILQALAVTGQVSYGAAIPIIMGQNIGTCVTALLSSVGTNKNARRTALVHLAFNVIGTVVWLTVFVIVKALLTPALLDQAASMLGIAVAHSVFNILCTALLLPASSLLERLAIWLIPDGKKTEPVARLDERLLATPPIALEQCRLLTVDMAYYAAEALDSSLKALSLYTPKLAASLRDCEEATDRYEDTISSFLLKLSSCRLSSEDSEEVTGLLKYIGDFERIADHAVNVAESKEELLDKGLEFSEAAEAELAVMCAAIREIMADTLVAFEGRDAEAAARVEPLEQVIDGLKEALRTRHILRMKDGRCSPEAGFVWSDLLTNLERVSDHCSNIAGCVIDSAGHNLNLHESLHASRHSGGSYQQAYEGYLAKYALTADAAE